MATSRSRERVARNFVKRYGRERLRQLLLLLANGESGQAIAETFDVSRERVRQWKNTFGTVVTLYQVHPEIEALLEETPSAGRGRP
ncbi:MAG: helix-turn-helix domain-containing protein [Alphaproteobacteria bacterium]|nr:helix-turn-helix domain-containing protein [Alphaproteobacteria bacterium]MCB9697862.1 helix-turn-helix domain-containing protein [Alphaproteobacteria bacterium]